MDKRRRKRDRKKERERERERASGRDEMVNYPLKESMSELKLREEVNLTFLRFTVITSTKTVKIVF